MTKQSVEERAKVAYDIARALLPELFVADKETFKATASRIARLESKLLFKLHERSLLLNHVANFVDASAADYRWLIDKYDAEHDKLSESYSGPGDESKEDYAYTPQEWKDKNEAETLDKHMSEGPLKETRDKGEYSKPEEGYDYPEKNHPQEWPKKASQEVEELKSEIAELKTLIQSSFVQKPAEIKEEATYKYGLDEKEEEQEEKKAEDRIEDARDAQAESGASWTKASQEEELLEEEELPLEIEVEAMGEELELEEEPEMELEEDFDEELMEAEAGFDMGLEEGFNMEDEMSATYASVLESDHELMSLFGDDVMEFRSSLEDIEESVKLGGDTNLPEALTRKANKKSNGSNELNSLFSKD
jgi:hypothetical protein